ncbi:MAG TPA: hypothetical protein VGR35_06855 [Tepidisphaeraceae bacterium]|nr:hypothetical protein [Tepidisphaeraceae bacterium]
MNEHERNLLSQLLRSGQSRGLNRPITRTGCEFVIEYGWWYTPTAIPCHLSPGNRRECFKNAFDLAFENADLTYVEGYATLDGGLRIHHAWVTDGQGNAIDNTWPRAGAAYAGVPFDTKYVNLNHVKNEAVICLIDDYLHDWPLLRDLGDHPGVWLEAAGKGRKKISTTS